MDQQLLTTIIIAICQTLFSAVLCYGVTSFRIGKFVQAFERLLKDVDDLKTEMKQFKQEITADMKEFKQEISHELKELSINFHKISNRIIICETLIGGKAILTQHNSPLALSPQGAEYLKNSGADIFVNQNFDELYHLVNSLQPQNAYDVQEYSHNAIISFKTDPRINPLKEWLFQEGLPFEDLVTVTALYLRDLILHKKGWNVDDITPKESKSVSVPPILIQPKPL